MPTATVVRIEDFADHPPRVDVVGAPFGHNIYVGPLVNDAAVEHGGLINLLGVDQSGSISEQGWRFVDPSLPQAAARNGLHILWITHDHSGPLCNGDLQVGFNTGFAGHHYANPIHTKDQNLGPVTEGWITVYSDATLLLLFKSSRDKQPVPGNGSSKVLEV